MFKNLREKIGDSETRKKKSSNGNVDITNTDGTTDNNKNSGFRNISRFSSLSSLVSDVGSAITKSITTQHIQPLSVDVKNFYDNESISEYDDSVTTGDVFTKEELFSKYEKAKVFAKQYKIRYLEVMELNKKMELENEKLSQILSSSQDTHIRRTNELREQIELDKKGKKDVEENYMLMIEEKAELVNVLKLQVNLLKEGKDLPPELEADIKEKHEKQVQFEKQREDEIKDLKATVSHRDNLLQRCKDKINSLNSELSELKMKFSNIKDVSVCNDSPRFSEDVSDHTFDIVKKYEDQIKCLTKEFEEKKLQLESEIMAKFEEKSTNCRFEEQELQERIRKLVLENENLQEQFNIKTKIIQDLMNDQFNESQKYCDPSILNSPGEKLKLCKLILNKYPVISHPVIDELFKVLNSNDFPLTVEVLSTYTENEVKFTDQVTSVDINYHSTSIDFDEEKKSLLSRIEQLEKIKLDCEEENTIREKELTELNLLIEKERKQFDTKSRSLENQISNLQDEINALTSKYDQTHSELTEVQLNLSQTESEKEEILEERKLLTENAHTIEETVITVQAEKDKLLKDLQKSRDEYNELEVKLEDVSKLFEANQKSLMDKSLECKNLTDKIDELITSVQNLNSEREALSANLKVNLNDSSSQEERFNLSIIEIKSRYEQELEDMRNSDKNKSTLISKLEIEMKQLKDSIEIDKINLENLEKNQSSFDDLKITNEKLILEMDQMNQLSIELDKKNETLQTQLDNVIQENSELTRDIELLKETQLTREEEIGKIKNSQNGLNIVIEQLEKEREKFIDEIKEKSHLLEQGAQISLGNSELLETLQADIDKLKLEKEFQVQSYESLNTDFRNFLIENETLKTEITKSTEILKQKDEIIQESTALLDEYKIKMVNFEDLSMKVEVFTHIKDNLLEILKESDLKNDDMENDINMALMNLKNLIKAMKLLIEEKDQQLNFVESQCKLLNAALNDESQTFSDIQSNISLHGVEESICKLINRFQQNLSAKEESKNSSLVDLEKRVDEKLQKSHSLLLQTYKQLINIFHFVDINPSQLTEIDKSLRTNIMKRLKEYVKNKEQLITNLNEVNVRLEITEKELKSTIEINHNIQTELDELKTSVENDRDRLRATGMQLENSLHRLNEVADEKGRLDEEKQSLRKELKELHEKISNLKVEFEKQSLEKHRLEMQFDESLEKVRLNHTALEEVYKKELEKQHGYQRNLEEQIASHKESSSIKLSESERKLEEVLNQSEQLLQLNNQYKQLLDESKLETKDVLDQMSLVNTTNYQLQSQVDQLNIANNQLNEDIIHLKSEQSEISAERDKLNNELMDLHMTNQKSTEEVKLLHSANENKTEKWETIKTDYDNLKSINEDLERKITKLEKSMKELDQFKITHSDIIKQKQKLENEMDGLMQKLEKLEMECHSLNAEKNELLSELSNSRKTCDKMKIQNGELKNLLNTYKSQIDDINLELEQIKTRHDIEKDELEQQFAEERGNMEEDINIKVKKLAKEFNDKMAEKEKEFQHTFEEALTNVRKEESRMKIDLRATVDELNKSIIELETEKNQLLDQISENEITIQNSKKQLESNRNEIQSSNIKIEELSNAVSVVSKERDELTSKKISQMNQTVDSGTCYEEPFLDSIAFKDHEVLLMHCSDLEEQLKQLQAENISLKKLFNVNSDTPFSVDSQETIIKSSKTRLLSNQASVSSDINRSFTNFQGTLYRSPNMSCSEYTFCPVPITEATDYEYLHDVLLKYMTGLETEILAKVVCTVMKFTNEETSRVLTFEQDRNKFIRRIL